MSRERLVCDVLIIGGGPAGSAAAIQLARQGRRVLLLERQRFPRFHIGESLLPASNVIFQRLGLGERLAAEKLVEKRGASFATEDGEFSSYIDFTVGSEVPAPLTYQVLRSRFDEILLDLAKEAGADVRELCRVCDIAFKDDGVHAVATPEGGELLNCGEALNGGDTFDIEAEVALDASGQAGFLSKRLGLRRFDPELRHVALYAHFEGIPRPSSERSGDIRIISCRDMSWIWMIPVSETVTSVGVVMSRATHAGRGKETPESILDRILTSTPVAAEQTVSAKRVSKACYEADFCYQPTAFAGHRWLLAGDAAAFLDPAFSTGVMLALESGLDAAVAVDHALEEPCWPSLAFDDYQHTQRQRYRFFRRFAYGFYDPAFRDLFFQPTNRCGMLDAIVSGLSGNWRLSRLHRLRLRLFFALVWLQRYLPVAPRFHTRGSSSAKAVRPYRQLEGSQT